ncbi:STAS/SEC14 domain-containing protein [Maridesulfovibrio hydrothermalis]|uniref:SpoIIAA-like n=1 Tax=Maridesulfovibrio hydrothermalis AM13 = DSM 14728 TaxID=1121451 RepID=L0RA48_9BACT|nr:STAS/SEC14 domain-containing protein [Maridesulfovibrio hydrothermalis]CCO23663.1 conserved protein of unknown function [Maridesulfovibrio hydrothermalis AM13 = DSM 14728]
MVELIEIAPKVLGLKIDGKITEEDMKKVIAVCEDKMKAEERIAIYVEIVQMNGVTFSALKEDLKFALPNFKRFSRKAVVSDSKWHEPLIKIGDKLFPSIEIKHFNPEEREAAVKWVKE